MTIIQTAVLGITAVALAVQLKGIRPEYSLYMILTSGILIGYFGLSRLELIMETVSSMGKYITVKNALGGQVEMFGKLSILAVSAPILTALFETLQVFMR